MSHGLPYRSVFPGTPCQRSLSTEHAWIIMLSQSGQVNKQERPWRRGTDWAAGRVLREGGKPSSPEAHGAGADGGGGRGRKGIQYIK